MTHGQLQSFKNQGICVKYKLFDFGPSIARLFSEFFASKYYLFVIYLLIAFITKAICEE